jgi:hypothetical protein
MRFTSKLLAVGALSAAAIALAAPSQAATFASFSQSDSNPNISWTRDGAQTGGTLSSVPPTVSVLFNFLNPALGNNLSATLSLNASDSASPAVGAGGAVGAPLDQPNLAGSFTFTYTGLTYVDGLGHTHNPGDTLLNGVFTLGDITSNMGSNSGSVIGSTAEGDSITYSSQWMSFANSVSRGYAFNMTSMTPAANAGAGHALRSFTASAGGSFANVAAVPEPVTWAIMITGLGMLGLAARRRRSLGLATA